MSLAQIDFYGDPCRECGHSWTTPESDVTSEIAGLASA